MITFCDVSFCYGEEDAKGGTDACIDGMSFEIRAGECVVLCGRSGAGKSTVLRLIAGFLRVDAARFGDGGGKGACGDDA